MTWGRNRTEPGSARGLSLASAPLTALEAATCAGSAVLDRSLQEGIVTVDGLAAATSRNAGRHGMAEARRLLKVIAGDAESESERRFRALLELHHITGWCAQYPFGVYAIDFAFPAQKLALEARDRRISRRPAWSRGVRREPGAGRRSRR